MSTQSGIAQVTGSDISPLDEVFPQTLVDALVSTAQANGRYFTSLGRRRGEPRRRRLEPHGRHERPLRDRAAGRDRAKIQGNTNLNSEAMPGILLVLGGSTLRGAAPRSTTA